MGEERRAFRHETLGEVGMRDDEGRKVTPWEEKIRSGGG